MNESEKIDPRELSPLALAFVGDSVLEQRGTGTKTEIQTNGTEQSPQK